jgi:hypothetical protein
VFQGAKSVPKKRAISTVSNEKIRMNQNSLKYQTKKKIGIQNSLRSVKSMTQAGCASSLNPP